MEFVHGVIDLYIIIRLLSGKVFVLYNLNKTDTTHANVSFCHIDLSFYKRHFKVLTAMKIQVAVFWTVTPCNDVVGCQLFGAP